MIPIINAPPEKKKMINMGISKIFTRSHNHFINFEFFSTPNRVIEIKKYTDMNSITAKLTIKYSFIIIKQKAL